MTYNSKCTWNVLTAGEQKKKCGHTMIIEEKNGWVLEKKYQKPNLSFSSNLKIVIAAPKDISAFYLASSLTTEELH